MYVVIFMIKKKKKRPFEEDAISDIRPVKGKSKQRT